MITIEDQINEDVCCLRHYFEQKFILLEDAKRDELNLPMIIRDRAGPYDPIIRISYFIKPDMLINIYCLFDYWVKRVCDDKKGMDKLEHGWKDMNGKNDLKKYHKYLTKYGGVDLTCLKPQYQRINELRRIRNQIIHQGGHVLDENRLKSLSNIQGVSVVLGTIVIQDEFVWSCLDSVQQYLVGVAKS